MKHLILPTATAVALLSASGASASSISVNTIQGDWIGAVGGASVVITNGSPTSSIDWGEGFSAPSGYDFTAELTPMNDPVSPFKIGTFTHRNQEIALGTQIQSVNLHITLEGTAEGSPFSLSPTWLFDHDETPNIKPCPPLPNPHATVCDDLVTVSLNDGSTSPSVTVGKRTYTFTLIGFSTDGGATISNQFQTPEFGTNEAHLFARIDIAVIPLPAAGWLLLGGLASLAALRRRRKSA